MNEVDDLILEFFQDLETASNGVALTPGVVHYNIVEIQGASEKSRSTFSRRMGDLAEVGLLNLIDEDRRLYQITEKGIEYLKGNIDASELEHPQKS